MEVNYEIRVLWSDEDEAYVATIPDVPGCSADGATPEEAVAEAKVALEGILAARIANDMPVPEDPVINRFRENYQLFNLSEIARRIEMKNSTLRSRLLRNSSFHPEETKKLRRTLSEVIAWH